MKKIYFMFCAAMALAGCSNDEYTDWANPQSNAQDDAKTVALSVADASAINFATLTSDSVQLFIPTVAVSDQATNTYKAKMYNTDKSASVTVNADSLGVVPAADIKSAVETLYGKSPETRNIAMDIAGYTNINGQSILNTTTANASVTLVAPFIDTAYYLVGDMFKIDDTNNGWNKTCAKEFTHVGTGNVYDNPTFTITFSTTADNQCWKIIPKTIYDGKFWNEGTTGVVGTVTDGDVNTTGNLTVTKPESGKIAKKGKYIMTINMMDYSYTITEAPSELYMTGSEYGWGNTWNQLTPVNGADGEYWGIYYLHADELFKFAPQNAWGNDFGSQATINDVANSGIAADGTNLKVKNAGWYLLDVTNNGTQKLNVYKPNVYLIGTTAGGEWSIADSHKFTTPTTADGDFVSPAFTESGEVRMCVKFGDFDWWKTEFIVLNGKIEYRGNGGDQERVKVTKGQKAYINFKTNTGSFK